MLLSEQKQGDAFIAYYDSSNVIASKYNPKKKLLAVIFIKGGQYVYEGVIAYHYARFKQAKSQGKALNQYISKNYTYIKGEQKVDVAPLLEQIKKIKQEQKLNG
jgi:hypothetical protein